MNKNKILANTLCASMMLSNITPVVATVTNETSTFDDTTESAIKQTEVLYNKAGNYFVTIPKTISLGSDKQSPYSVKVEGDIPSDKQVYVSPIDNIKDTENFDFYMHDTNTANPKADVVATVTQNKFYWNFIEVANGYTETNNKVTALDLTSGTWKGTFDFEINMKALNGDESHTHSYSENVTKEPTCTEDGEKTLTCSCGDTKTESIPATGHNIEDGNCTECDVIVKSVNDLLLGDVSFDMGTVLAVKKADTLKVNDKVIPEQNFTFDKEGDYKVTVETTDSDTNAPIIININITIIINQETHTHNYTETITKNATCTKAGEKTLTCSCGDSKTETIPSTGHNYGTDDKCTNCGELNPNHKHSYTETVTKEASCEENGQKTLTCICGDSKTEVIPSTGHNYADGTCKNCGEADPNYNIVDPYPLAPENAYMNWNYTLDETKKTITLNYYSGSETDVIVYSAYPIDGTTYKTKIASNDSNKASNYMFAGKGTIQSIKFGANINTSETTSMSCMFSSCKALTSLDVSNLNTSNVTTMNNMFYYCQALTSLDLSNWNTSNVTTMNNMFRYCQALTSLDLSNWDTGNVTNMSYMFSNCTSLTSLDVSDLNTSNVTNMKNMFYYCQALISLDLSNWNTGNVTTMDGMFSYCQALTSLDLNNWDTSNVTDMQYMFWNCSSLTSIDLSSFDTSKVTSMASMFSSCSSLISLNLSNFNTSNVTSLSSMFDGCTSLTSLDLSSFDTNKVTRMGAVFRDCTSLTSLDLSSFDTRNATDMQYLFKNSKNLKTIYVSRTKWSTSQATTKAEMFTNCGTSSVTYK